MASTGRGGHAGVGGISVRATKWQLRSKATETLSQTLIAMYGALREVAGVRAMVAAAVDAGKVSSM